MFDFGTWTLVIWNNTGTGKWVDVNWNPNGYPSNSDDVYIDNGGTVEFDTTFFTTSAGISSLTIGDKGTGAGGTLLVAGGKT